MKKVKHYTAFNHRRYGNPWIAKLNPKTLKPDFSEKVGGYTGGYNKGEEGDLYLFAPEENAIYAYGQRDYRGGNTEMAYLLYKNGEFEEVTPSTLIDVLNDMSED